IESGGAMVINDAALQVDLPSSSPVIIDGELRLESGSVTITNSAQLRIGHQGRGTLTVSNGTLRASYPIVGASEGANGTWQIDGGTNIISTTFDIADSLTATGTVTMTEGYLSAIDTYVGLFGNGRMIISNGTFQCFGLGSVGSQPGSQGQFTAVGGLS